MIENYLGQIQKLISRLLLLQYSVVHPNTSAVVTVTLLYVLESGIMRPPTFFLFKPVLAVLKSLIFHMNFIMNFLLLQKTFLSFDRECPESLDHLK